MLKERLQVRNTREDNKRKGRIKTYKNKPKAIKKMAIETYISLITVNLNGLNTPIKAHRQAEWI